ncbi:hypothetical protein ACFYQ5_35895 [Streptomyces sp. NPDC005794]
MRITERAAHHAFDPPVTWAGIAANAVAAVALVAVHRRRRRRSS